MAYPLGRGFLKPWLPSEISPQLLRIPYLARRYGRGVCVVRGDKLTYYPIKIGAAPLKFQEVLLTYELEHEVVLVSGKKLTEATPFSKLHLSTLDPQNHPKPTLAKPQSRVKALQIA